MRSFTDDARTSSCVVGACCVLAGGVVVVTGPGTCVVGVGIEMNAPGAVVGDTIGATGPG